jgi:hypothetical protein
MILLPWFCHLSYMDEMEEKQKSSGYFTLVRSVFWLIMCAIVAVLVFLFYGLWSSGRPSSMDQGLCVMNQRNIQQSVRDYQNMHDLKAGTTIDWAELIGPGKFMDMKPMCPVHGEYTYSPVIPEIGVLAAPCQDPNHRPTDIQGW